MIHIICFGNLWQGDDGFGVHVFRRLSQKPMPAHVKIFEAGVAGLGALEYFENCRKVVIVDAIKCGGPVGTIRRLSFQQTFDHESPFSMHQFGVDHLLGVLPLSFEGRLLPEVVIVGAEISEIVPFTDRLSFQTQALLDPAINLIQSECLN